MIELHVHGRASARDADSLPLRPPSAPVRPLGPAAPRPQAPAATPSHAEELPAWMHDPGRLLVAVGDAESVLWDTPRARVAERRYRLQAPPSAGLTRRWDENHAPGAVGPADTSTLIRATLDADGRPHAWWQRFVGAPASAAEAYHLPYDIPHQTIHAAEAPGAAGLGDTHVQRAYATECFVDELAHAAGHDPCAYRHALLPAGSRHRRVLDTAAMRADWATAVPAGHGRGIALAGSSGSVAAQVIEVSADEHGRPRVHRVVAVLDGGRQQRPAAAVHQQVDAAVRTALARLSEALGGLALPAPAVEVHLLDSDAPAGRLVEPHLWPIAPALCNALFAATGRRVRDLPAAPACLSAAAA